MSVIQYATDDVYSLAPVDRHVLPSRVNDVLSDALPTSESSIRMNPMSNIGESSGRTGSLQQIDQEVLKKKYFTDLTVIDGKKYRFCKNVALDRCKDTRSGAQKGRYASSTSGTILKRHVEICLGMVFDGDKTPKKDMKEKPSPSKKDHNEKSKKDHSEALAHVIVENMVY